MSQPPDITRQLVDAALSAALHPRRPEGVSVLVASRDPAVIEKVAPMVVRRLYPARYIGAVLWHEPVDDPPWSEAIVEVRP